MFCTEPGRQAKETALTLVRCPQLTDEVTEGWGGGQVMGSSPGCLFGFYPCHWGQAPPSLTQGLARADSSGGQGQRSLSPFPTSPSSAAHVISVSRQEYDVSREWQDAGYPGSFENTSLWEGRSYQGPRRGRLVGVGVAWRSTSQTPSGCG